MRAGAQSPEELETLLEDAILTHDADSLELLFEQSAVLCLTDGAIVAEGRREIVRTATALWRGDVSYLAHPSTVLQSGDTCLVLGSHAVNVCRRGPDRSWRYAICLLSPDTTHKEGAASCNRRSTTRA